MSAPHAPVAKSPQVSHDVIDVDGLAAACRENVRAAGGIPSAVPLTREGVAEELARMMDRGGMWQAPPSLDGTAKEIDRLMAPAARHRAIDTTAEEEVAAELEKLMGPSKGEAA